MPKQIFHASVLQLIHFSPIHYEDFTKMPLHSLYKLAVINLLELHYKPVSVRGEFDSYTYKGLLSYLASEFHQPYIFSWHTVSYFKT